MFAVVLPGPPGAGKTSVLTALADALSDDDVPHAAVEVEALTWTHPALNEEQWMRHVQATCALYREAGHRLLLVAQTVETDADLAQLLDAVGADEYFLVRLEAQPATASPPKRMRSTTSASRSSSRMRTCSPSAAAPARCA